MLELIYKETKATKKAKAVRYVAGFIQLAEDKRPALSVYRKALAVLAEPVGVYNAFEVIGAMTTVREYESAEAPKHSKPIVSTSLVRAIQGAHAVKLSKGEKAYLLNAMRVLQAETGVDSLSLAKVA